MTYLQVFTNSAHGESLGPANTLWDNSTRTLYQPWGVPTAPNSWNEAIFPTGKTEFWVGSIWDNELGQGNINEIRDYRIAMKDFGINFKQAGGVGFALPRRLGGAGIFTAKGVSERQALQLVQKSPIGASIVGKWQKDKHYVPCRIFKNVAAGHLPVSNSNFHEIFGESMVYSDDYHDLVSKVRSVSEQDKRAMVKAAQKAMEPYTYEEALLRMFTVL